MLRAQKAIRLHIGFFGRRNTGKSALVNAFTRQDVAIVSEVAGTTTDPVEKPMEFLPLGPVLLIDTAGVDDEGSLGEQRVTRTRRVLDRTDLALLVTAENHWSDHEEELLRAFKDRKVPVIVVLNKSDLGLPCNELRDRLRGLGVPWVAASARTGEGMADLRQAILRTAPEEALAPPPLLADLISPGDLAVLVVPIDMEAPKGRLILPQVQTIRELIDSDASALVVKERELRTTLRHLREHPKLVITDSQAFLKVAADTPRGVPLTSFSILFARQRGDLNTFVEGALAIERLRAGDRVLVCEACSHHPIGDDIGRVKIPRWITQFVGGHLDFHTTCGHDFPEDLASYQLVIHCGGCVQNRREMLTRIARCQAAGVPITNYGLTIATTLGILERGLSPFPVVLEHLARARNALVPKAMAFPAGCAAPSLSLSR